jgi:pimeloyl-ACP methyl ester carboxylesterase
MTHQTLDFNGINLHYQDEGNGDIVLVLIHGFMSDLRVWSYYVFSYMREIRVITIDLLGHGQSEWFENTPSTMELQAQAVKTVLDHLNIKECVMVGHSMGGYVSLAFAEAYPQYIKGLCLLHSHALPDGNNVKEKREQTCNIINQNRANFIISFIPNLFAPASRDKFYYEIKDLQDSALDSKAEGLILAQKGIATRTSKIELLRTIDIPVLFIIGKQDPRIQLDMVIAQASFPKHSEVLILDNVGHMGHIESRDIIKRRLLSFTYSCFAI